MKMNELVIYTDESEKTGRYYSNFYGGLLVRACDIEPIISTLESINFISSRILRVFPDCGRYFWGWVTFRIGAACKAR